MDAVAFPGGAAAPAWAVLALEAAAFFAPGWRQAPQTCPDLSCPACPACPEAVQCAACPEPPACAACPACEPPPCAACPGCEAPAGPACGTLGERAADKLVGAAFGGLVHWIVGRVLNRRQDGPRGVAPRRRGAGVVD